MMKNTKFKNLINFSTQAIISATTFTLVSTLFKHGLIVDWSSSANHFFEHVNVHPESGDKFFTSLDMMQGAGFGLAYASYDKVKGWFKKSKDLEIAKEYLTLYQKSSENPESKEFNQNLINFIEKEKDKLEKIGLNTSLTPQIIFEKLNTHKLKI
jgi:hypothetical protein